MGWEFTWLRFLLVLSLKETYIPYPKVTKTMSSFTCHHTIWPGCISWVKETLVKHCSSGSALNWVGIGYGSQQYPEGVQIRSKTSRYAIIVQWQGLLAELCTECYWAMRGEHHLGGVVWAGLKRWRTAGSHKEKTLNSGNEFPERSGRTEENGVLGLESNSVRQKNQVLRQRDSGDNTWEAAWA